jgi:hypothetical protein
MSTIEIVDVARADMAAFVATAHGFWGEPGEDGMELVKDVLARALLARRGHAAVASLFARGLRGHRGA